MPVLLRGGAGGTDKVSPWGRGWDGAFGGVKDISPTTSFYLQSKLVFLPFLFCFSFLPTSVTVGTTQGESACHAFPYQR